MNSVFFSQKHIQFSVFSFLHIYKQIYQVDPPGTLETGLVTMCARVFSTVYSFAMCNASSCITINGSHLNVLKAYIFFGLYLSIFINDITFYMSYHSLSAIYYTDIKISSVTFVTLNSLYFVTMTIYLLLPAFVGNHILRKNTCLKVFDTFRQPF